MTGGEQAAARAEAETPRLEVQAGAFSGPLDLLLHLIERNRIDIHNIPIAEIADQYIAILEAQPILDMELASEFLVMAATLLQIKSRMLLPLLRPPDAEEPEEDPRGELVLRLLAYRRARIVAQTLRERQARYAGCQLHVPLPATALGIEPPEETDRTTLDPGRFVRARDAVVQRNQLRYSDIRDKLEQILTRERVSLRQKIGEIWRALKQRASLLFEELFPRRASRGERVTGFLALLELLRLNRVEATQSETLGPIEIRRSDEAVDEGGEEGDRLSALLFDEERGGSHGAG